MARYFDISYIINLKFQFIMKKLLLGLSVFMMTLVFAQNYPDYYPTGNAGDGQYDYTDSEDFYFPEEYYYEYPEDYYNTDLYSSYYSDYRRAITQVNWNRFFRTYRLSSWQIQEVMMLNNSFPNFAAWNSYYRYNPDRWYYDRFYALQRILGPHVYVVFQNNYFNGYNPIVYYQNYNRHHYARNIYVIPRYRTVNINIYKVNRTQYHQNNSRKDIGFAPTRRERNAQNSGPGFRDNAVNPRVNSGFGTSEQASPSAPRIRTEGAPRSPSFGGEVNTRTRNSGFRDDAQPTPPIKRNNSSSRPAEATPPARRSENSGTRTPASPASGGQRFTTR